MNYDQFFDDAKSALRNVNELNGRVSDLQKKLRRLDAAFENEKKSVAASIEQTIKKRRAEIEKTYDGELNKLSDSLRRANAKRTRAKNQGIRDRISESTFELRDTNKKLNRQIKANYKNEDVPFYCNFGIFYTLFFPQNIFDILAIIIAFAFFFVGLPFGTWHFFFADKGILALVIIYVIDIVVFGGLVVLINRATVLKHHDVIKAAVEIRKQIASNKKEIDRIAQDIENDKSEEHYNLGSFDDEITRIKQKRTEVSNNKHDALTTFENVTKNIIADEINNNAKAKLDGMAEELTGVSEKLTKAEADRHAATVELSNNYEVYLGRDFMTEEKLDALAEIMRHGTATNLNEAIEEYKNNL